jgi:hypothetical protein
MSIYIITTGEYSDYSIVSVWSSLEAAERNCKLLNAGRMHDDFRVEDYPLDSPHEGREYPMSRGFKAFYDFELHGLEVHVTNVVIDESLYQPFQEARVHVTSTFVMVLADSKERCLRILFDTVAEKRANEEGIVL